MRHVLKALLASAIFACANASAVVINTMNTPVAFTISEDLGGGIVLTATGSVTITAGLGTDALDLQVILNNDSTLNGQPYTPTDGVTLIGWGFGVDPDMTDVTFTNGSGSGMIDATPNESLPGLTGIEVCAWGGNGCSGNLPGGILAGDSQMFSLVLAGTWGSSVTFDPIGARFRMGENFFSLQCTGECLAPAAVPEPETVALVAIALLMMGWTVARKRRESRATLPH
jgi:hypothetical protein